MYLDFQKTFDKVMHIKKCDLSEGWMRDLLMNRKQGEELKGRTYNFSAQKSLSSVILQGSEPETISFNSPHQWPENGVHNDISQSEEGTELCRVVKSLIILRKSGKTFCKNTWVVKQMAEELQQRKM